MIYLYILIATIIIVGILDAYSTNKALKLGLKESIEEIYQMKQLDLTRKGLKEIPKEIGQLHNLQRLYLDNNRIKEIPKELGQLHNLKSLWLNNNQIKEIP